MVLTKLTVLVHDISDSVSIEDYIDDNGKYINIGTQALAALKACKAIHFKDSEGQEIFIPYHAVVGYSFEREDAEYTAPEDDFCKSADAAKPLYTVTWMNGEESLGSELYAEGSVPSYKGEEPEGTGTFVGWSDTADGEALEELPPVTEATTFYAVFEAGDPENP